MIGTLNNHGNCVPHEGTMVWKIYEGFKNTDGSN